MTHPQRCEMCRFHTREMGYDDMIFCNFGGGKTAVYKPVLRFINVRGCASHNSAPLPKGYICTEEDICTIRDYILGAFYEGENKEKIYDLIKSEFSVIRSHPYNPQAGIVHQAGSSVVRRKCDPKEIEQIKQAEREKVIAQCEIAIEHCSNRSFCIHQMEELRQEGKQEQP